MLFGYECTNLMIQDHVCKGAYLKKGADEITVEAEHVVVATGRRGAEWLEHLCTEHGIEHRPGTVDIGVRVEVRNEVMEQVNKVL